MTSSSRRDEIAALLALRDREGLTYEELADRCGLAATTLSWWSWRLRRDARQATSFAELEVAADAHDGQGSGRVTIRRGDWEIEISNADQLCVREVLSVIGELPC